MHVAFHEARKALLICEVPVGCVLVFRNEKIISLGHNETNRGRCALLHAEIIAIQKLVSKLENSQSIFTKWVLNHGGRTTKLESILKECVLYVTVEPCIMCASALRILGIGKVYFGCRNDRFGGNGTTISIHGRNMGNEISQKTSVGNSLSSFGAYESICVGGERLQQSINLLKDFYKGENLSAPEGKRIMKE